MPIDRELNMFGVHVPDQAIIHGVGLNKVKIHITSKVQNSELQKFWPIFNILQGFELMLTKYQVEKTIDNLRYFKIVAKRKTCEIEGNEVSTIIHKKLYWKAYENPHQIL